jgi:hypothetical protein
VKYRYGKKNVIAVRDCLPRGGDDTTHSFYNFLKTCKIKEGTFCISDDEYNAPAIKIYSPSFNETVPHPSLKNGLYYTSNDFREATNVDKLIEFNRRKRERRKLNHNDK